MTITLDKSTIWMIAVFTTAAIVVVILGIQASQETSEPEDLSGFNCPYLRIAAQEGDQEAQRNYVALCG